MFVRDDIVIITSGTHKGIQAKVLLDWGNKKHMCELLDADQTVDLFKEAEMAPLNADNALYADRIMRPMDDFM